MDTIQQYGFHISKMALLLKPKGVENSRRGFRWMDGLDIRKAAANAHMGDTCCVSWHVATAGFSQLFWLLPLGGFQVSLTFSSCICWGLSNPGRSRYVRFLVLASAIRVVKSTCWTAVLPQKIGTASEDQLPFFIRPLLDGFCLCVGGRFWSEVWSLSDPGCVLLVEIWSFQWSKTCQPNTATIKYDSDWKLKVFPLGQILYNMYMMNILWVYMSKGKIWAVLN